MRHLFKTATAVFLSILVCAHPGMAAEPPTWTWNDLVNHPERWPTEVKLTVDANFDTGPITKGTACKVLDVKAEGVQLLGSIGAFMLEPSETDLVEASNALAASLTPAQRELTYVSIAQDDSLWPLQIEPTVPMKFSGYELKAGTIVDFIEFDKSGQAVVGIEKVGTMMVPPQQTNLLAKAREIVEMPAEKRPRKLKQVAAANEQEAADEALKFRMPRLLKDATVDAMGQPVALPETPNYYVLYINGATCPRSERFAPRLVEYHRQKLADRKDILLISDTTDWEMPIYSKYMQEKGFTWPVIRLDRKDVHLAFGREQGYQMPTLVVLDRSGRVVMNSEQIPGDRIAAATATLTKLDALLADAK